MPGPRSGSFTPHCPTRASRFGECVQAVSPNRLRSRSLTPADWFQSWYAGAGRSLLRRWVALLCRLLTRVVAAQLCAILCSRPGARRAAARVSRHRRHSSGSIKSWSWLRQPRAGDIAELAATPISAGHILAASSDCNPLFREYDVFQVLSCAVDSFG